jgi:hypothetical protein
MWFNPKIDKAFAKYLATLRGNSMKPSSVTVTHRLHSVIKVELIQTRTGLGGVWF